MEGGPKAEAERSNDRTPKELSRMCGMEGVCVEGVGGGVRW